MPKEKVIKGVDMTNEKAKTEENEIDDAQDDVNTLIDPRGEAANAPRFCLKFCAQSDQHFTGDEETGDVLVEAVVAKSRTTFQCVIWNKQVVRIGSRHERQRRDGKTHKPRPVYL